MLVTPKKVPANWYRFDVSLSIGLLKAYVDGVESQVRRSIQDYKVGQEVVADESEHRRGQIGSNCLQGAG